MPSDECSALFPNKNVVLPVLFPNKSVKYLRNSFIYSILQQNTKNRANETLRNFITSDFADYHLTGLRMSMLPYKEHGLERQRTPELGVRLYNIFLKHRQLLAFLLLKYRQLSYNAFLKQRLRFAISGLRYCHWVMFFALSSSMQLVSAHLNPIC